MNMKFGLQRTLIIWIVKSFVYYLMGICSLNPPNIHPCFYSYKEVKESIMKIDFNALLNINIYELSKCQIEVRNICYRILRSDEIKLLTLSLSFKH